MRIVIISDSHKNQGAIDKILSAQPQASHLFFLGDNTYDIEDFEILYPNIKFHIVSGNCDYFSSFSSVGVEKINGVGIFYTHGHNYGVKSTLEHLKKAALERNCQIALYGHTHIAKTLYEDGIYIVNPGSCSISRQGGNSYAVIDITEKGIMPIIVRI